VRLKAEWDSELKATYEQAASAKSNNSKSSGDSQTQAKKLKLAEDEARTARDDAENTFDEAEKQLSTTMAREGCRKAIRSWELHEHVIRLSEAAAQPAKAKS
jgi:hypothetical protein